MPARRRWIEAHGQGDLARPKRPILQQFDDPAAMRVGQRRQCPVEIGRLTLCHPSILSPLACSASSRGT
jgi:hypothetical protein